MRTIGLKPGGRIGIHLGAPVQAKTILVTHSGLHSTREIPAPLIFKGHGWRCRILWKDHLHALATRSPDPEIHIAILTWLGANGHGPLSFHSYLQFCATQDYGVVTWFSFATKGGRSSLNQ